MRITGDWIRAEGVQTVLHLLTDADHQAFPRRRLRAQRADRAAGRRYRHRDRRGSRAGCRLARAAGLKAVPTGIDHGTVTIVVGGEPHEVTTFRRDVATDGRRATVAYAARIGEDAGRRDFTMNALYADADGRIVDPLGGLPDLQARRVRFVGDADARIREDYLRILRFFRFHAWYGDPRPGWMPMRLPPARRILAG